MAKVDKLLEQAAPHLDTGEHVLAAVQGNYEVSILGSDSVRSGVLLATERRIVFYAKKLGGYDLESFAYGNISSFEQSKNMMGHAVSFFASGNKVHMKWISDAAAMSQFVNVVKSQMNASAQQPTSTSILPPPPPPLTDNAESRGSSDDIMNKIGKLGELFAAGILTEDEFSTKKSELLSRI